MKPLISICVPVYNVAPYIERCAHSLLRQTYENLEFIFVDDASTDNSVALLQQVVTAYPQRRAQVRVLHNDRNHGLAYTRRAGIEAAHGDFVLCVDSDDHVEPDIVERLFSAVDSPECDMVIGTHAEVNDLLTAVLDGTTGNIWGHLIRRSLFANPAVHFAPEGLDYMEDRLVMLYLVGAARHFAVVHEPLYHYTVRAHSVSADKNEKHLRCMEQFWQLADAYLAERHLTERYSPVTDRQKITDKIHLLHFCKDFAVCRRYVGLFAKEESQRFSLQLSKGKRFTRFCAKHRLWTLWRIYKRFQ